MYWNSGCAKPWCNTEETTDPGFDPPYLVNYVTSSAGDRSRRTSAALSPGRWELTLPTQHRITVI